MNRQTHDARKKRLVLAEFNQTEPLCRKALVQAIVTDHVNGSYGRIMIAITIAKSCAAAAAFYEILENVRDD